MKLKSSMVFLTNDQEIRPFSSWKYTLEGVRSMEVKEVAIGFMYFIKLMEELYMMTVELEER